MAILDNLDNLDNIYLFKVKDFTTILLGRYDAENDVFYVQSGDGVKYEYLSYRVIWKMKLACVPENIDEGC